MSRMMLGPPPQSSCPLCQCHVRWFQPWILWELWSIFPECGRSFSRGTSAPPSIPENLYLWTRELTLWCFLTCVLVCRKLWWWDCCVEQQHWNSSEETLPPWWTWKIQQANRSETHSSFVLLQITEQMQQQLWTKNMIVSMVTVYSLHLWGVRPICHHVHTASAAFSSVYMKTPHWVLVEVPWTWYTHGDNGYIFVTTNGSGKGVSFSLLLLIGPFMFRSLPCSWCCFQWLRGTKLHCCHQVDVFARTHICKSSNRWDVEIHSSIKKHQQPLGMIYPGKTSTSCIHTRLRRGSTDVS